MNFTLRPSQTEILRYRGGKMGISAVPGSGKTFTLSALAAQIITSGALQPDQDVLIVTLVNSAVDNFASRIGKMVEQRGLIPHLGYRVRTLHGLAHDIVREKPALAGLEERFQIVDEREAEFIRKEAARAWLASHPDAFDDYLDPAMDESKRDWVRRQQLPDLVHSLALAFIRSAKDRRLTPEVLRQKLDASPGLPLAEMGWAIYADYQRALTYRGAVDFDDLIRLAYQILETDADYLARLQYRFPYILEDEAQDSSRIQEEILRLLAGHGNWVRVGDPNQAIFETFTTADPRLLRDFIAREADYKMELPVSGRSQPFIIDVANALIDWTNQSHPADSCRDALTVPYIQPTDPDDPQPNPAPDAKGIRIVSKKHTPDDEVEAVVKSIEKWLPDHADWTVAVLVPRNARGVEVVDALRKRNLPFVEMINSTLNTRNTAGAIANVIGYLADPSSPRKLSVAYQVWRRAWRDEGSLRGAVLATTLAPPARAGEQSDNEEEIASSGEALLAMTRRVTEILRKVGKVEEYLFPSESADNQDSLFGLDDSESDLIVAAELLAFREVIRRWQGTTLLPIDQMILTLSQELFTEPADLALAHKLALVLRQSANQHPDWRLPELTAELGVIAKNERRFIGFSADDSGFDPERHRGKVVVTTMHKAKGLEWDRVYLMSVNNYDFPSLQPYDRYISEKWFVRSGLNLEAEALGQLKALEATGEYDWYAEGAETQQARTDYVRERLRLLYVGITRAKRELVMTWNSGRQGDAQRCLPVEALVGWLESNQ
jgi:DNA helicase-2/ATP-dependent DNA helicase PcrA